MNLLYKPRFETQLSEEHRTSVDELTDEELFSMLATLPREDPRRLLALNPTRLRKLLSTGTVKVAELFHIAEDLIVIKRCC